MGDTDHLLATSTASGHTLVVQMVLTKYANADHECWPGQDRIASEARCSLRTAQRALDWLVTHERLNVVVNGGPENPAGDPTNLYQLPGHWFTPAKIGTRQNDTCLGTRQNDVQRDMYTLPSTEEGKENENTDSKSEGIPNPSHAKMTHATTRQNDVCLDATVTPMDQKTKPAHCEVCGSSFLAELVAPDEYQTTCSLRCTQVELGHPLTELEKERAMIMATLGAN